MYSKEELDLNKFKKPKKDQKKKKKSKFDLSQLNNVIYEEKIVTIYKKDLLMYNLAIGFGQHDKEEKKYLMGKEFQVFPCFPLVFNNYTEE